MAIKKDIELDNGIVTTYHRVSRISSFINYDCSIDVASYLSKEKRLLQKANPSFSNVFVDERTYFLPYDSEFNITKAYEYIKSLPEFEGAEDILEEDIPGIDINETSTSDDGATAGEMK